MNNMNNPYGRASASPRQSTSPAVAAKKTSSSSIRRDANTGGGVGVDGWATGNGLGAERSVVKREPRGQGSTDTLRINTKPERDSRDDLIDDLRTDLDKLRKVCTCVICQELLFEPYFFQCGHVYCYGCIVSWVGQAKSKKQRFCPQCRKLVKVEPSPAYVVRDMIETFVNRAEIMSPQGSGAELRAQQKEIMQQLKKDRSPGGPGLFRGIFKSQVLYGIRDPEDGVVRCPTCMWEVHGGRCENPQCGARVREARDGEDLLSDDESESGSSTQEGSERGIDNDMDLPVRWPESVVGEEDDWEDAVDDDDEFDIDDVSVRRRERFPGHYGNRGTHQRRNGRYDSEEEVSEADTEGTVGSLADFVDDDSPQQSRRRMSGPWALTSSPANTSSPIRPIGAARRQNARPIVIEDDDEDDNQSSFSEASSRPDANTRYTTRSARYQNSRHVSLSSDYDDDEQSLLESNGYQALLGNQTDHTATEDEEDEFSSPPIRRMEGRSNMIGRPGSVFSVPEEDDEDDDEDESEDQDGDIRMGGSDQRRVTGNTNTNAGGRQPIRRAVSGSRNQPIELDSASESEVAIGRRRTTRRAPFQTSTRSNYFSNHQRNPSGGARANRNNRLSMEINPDILGLFAQHGQQLRETQYNSLGRNSSSVSPARSLTPVQRNMPSRRSSAGSRGTTPLRGMLSSPPPFSPLQSPELASHRQAPFVINGTSSPAQITPSNNPWASPRSISLSPRLGGLSAAQNWGILSHFHNPQRTASPMGVRVRSRASSNRLRGSGSRIGLRSNSATPSSPLTSSFTGGTSIAGLVGRAPPTPQQQHRPQFQPQTPQQQQNQRPQPQPQTPQQQQQQRPQPPQPPQPPQQQQRQQQQQQQQRQQPTAQQGGGRPGGSPRVLTAEDIRARGEQIRQNQLRMINGGGPLQQSRGGSNVGGGSQSTEGLNGAPSSIGGVGLSPDVRRGNRLGALIGGGPANQRGGGPMLVIGSEDDHF
ncbi:hypothetical protein BDD12DRAFT_440267 [Trichophaea hybrida]|nr:hypothetical protein BDD12DRAFT_440267 [Trichophaea hybrida]